MLQKPYGVQHVLKNKFLALVSSKNNASFARDIANTISYSKKDFEEFDTQKHNDLEFLRVTMY